MRALAFSTALFFGLATVGPNLRLDVPVAHAADGAEAQAKEMFRRAEVHFNLREFDRALELYTEAYRLKPLPGFLFNIAQCHRFAERFEDAAFSFRVYLQRAPSAPNRAEVEELIAQMERQAAAVSEEASKKSPPAQPPSSEATAPPPAEETPAPPDPPAAIAAPMPAAEGEPKPARVSPWVWSTGGLGVALLATGVVTGQMASSRSDRYNDDDTSLEERERLRDSGRTLVATSLASFAVGGAAVVTSAVLWWMGRGTKDGGTQVTLMPGAGGLVFAVAGGFQ